MLRFCLTGHARGSQNLRRMSSAAASVLPECVCVHCGQRFNAQHLTYGVDVSALPTELAECFTQLDRDADAHAFLLSCGSKSRAVRLAQSAAASLLRSSMSLTDANGVLGRGELHVLSQPQATLLLGDAAGGVLLDVGAGDGSVTSRLAPLFAAVVATEVSAPMLRRLRARGFAAVLETESVCGAAAAARAQGVPVDEGGFDVVSCLNVLDRCDSPLALLADLRALVKPDTGRLLLAVVLPFRPFVESGTTRRPPSQSLQLPRDASFELSLGLLWTTVLQPAGFAVHTVSRVPYLSDGDSQSPVYTLDDAILVLSAPKRAPT